MQKIHKDKSYIIGLITQRSDRSNPKFTWSRTFIGKRLIELNIRTIADFASNDKTEPLDPNKTYYVYEMRNALPVYFGEFSPEMPKMKPYAQPLSDTGSEPNQTEYRQEVFFNHSLSSQKENTKTFDRMCGLLEKQVESLQNQIATIIREKEQDIQRIIEQKDNEIDRITQNHDSQLSFFEKEVLARDKIITELRQEINTRNTEIFDIKNKFEAFKTLIEAKEFVRGKETEFEQRYDKKLAQVQQSNQSGGLSGITQEMPSMIAIAREIKALFSDSGTNTGKVEMAGISGVKPRAVIGNPPQQSIEPPSVKKMQPPQPQIQETAL